VVQADPNLSNPQPSIDPFTATSFDAAREFFKQGDYPSALSSVDQAITRTPSDAVMHEFRSLVLFALRDYRQSAAVIHSVLAVGPGWDWTTMSALYPDPQVYSDQLRMLERYVRDHPRAADGHFLLGYHDMIASRREEAIAELQQVVQLMPTDRLAGELLTMVKGPAKNPTPEAPPTDPNNVLRDDLNPPPAPSPQTVAEQSVPNIDSNLLPGTWNASRTDGSRFRLAMSDDGKFTWKYSTPNQKGEEFGGTYTVDGPVLTLQRQEGGALAGVARFSDDGKMNFKLVGGPTEDPGLDFSK
jgi:tetratricopeptide (TPR) repeat protein